MTPPSTDVKGLNHAFQVRTELEPHWNSGNPRRSTVETIYVVCWVSEENRREGYRSVASVKLLGLTKTPVSLTVEASKYVVRKPLAFANLDVPPAVPKNK